MLYYQLVQLWAKCATNGREAWKEPVLMYPVTVPLFAPLRSLTALHACVVCCSHGRDVSRCGLPMYAPSAVWRSRMDARVQYLAFMSQNPLIQTPVVGTSNRHQTQCITADSCPSLGRSGIEPCGVTFLSVCASLPHNDLDLEGGACVLIDVRP
jgi:hypothetical protein